MFTAKLKKLIDFALRTWQSIATKLGQLPIRKLLASFLALSVKEKIILTGSFLLLIGGLVFAAGKFYLENTLVLPRKGGVYTEGVIGTPRHINPLLPDTSQADTILESLIFSSLLKADNNGGVQNDLAESWEEIDSGQVYLVSLRENLVWHDGQALTAQDVVFTLNLIQNPELQHPLNQFFKGIEVEAISNRTLKFTLSEPYRFFPQYLTFKILPRHLWSEVPANNFIFSELNLEPVGSGPYQLRKISGSLTAPLEYSLAAFPQYYLAGPYLNAVNVRFFNGEQQALNALRKKEISGLSNLPLNEIDNLNDQANYQIFNPVAPEYFGIFFNEQLDILQDLKFKQALEAAIDKHAIVEQVFSGRAEVIDSPFWNETEQVAKYNPDLAKELLAGLGWNDADEDGILEKKLSRSDRTASPLEISLTVLDTPENLRLSQLIQVNFQEVGIRLITKNIDLNEFNNRLRSGSFQLLLLGEIIPTGKNQDLYPFFSSEQSSPVGMNFSHYKNIELDRLLTNIRQETDDNLAELYSQAANVLRNDLVAIFLYRPQRYFAVSDYFKLPAITFLQAESERLARINEWHIYTQRVWQ